jgi:hypothetical protein
MQADYPALDRSADDRPSRVLGALTAALDDQHAIFLTDLNWQLQNGLSYFTKVTRPEIADARANDEVLVAAALARDNHAIGRDVALTARARDTIARAYGPLLPTEADRRVFVPSLSETVGAIAPGTRYVLSVLKPSRDTALDEDDLARAAATLGAVVGPPRGDYTVVAGVTGAPPAYTRESNRPFATQLTLDGVHVTIRMESWLEFDTIRRMGFGHVIAARRHTLIIERGVSFVAFDSAGRPLATAYAANIFAPQPRYLLSWHR